MKNDEHNGGDLERNKTHSKDQHNNNNLHLKITEDNEHEHDVHRKNIEELDPCSKKPSRQSSETNESQINRNNELLSDDMHNKQVTFDHGQNNEPTSQNFANNTSTSLDHDIHHQSSLIQ